MAQVAACCAISSALALNVRAAGTWIPLQTHPAEGIGTMLLLPDGTVMAQGGGGGSVSQNWYKLTPGAKGGYTNGIWTTRATMNYGRLYYASQVLPDGRVFFAGAEYGNGTTNAETYSVGGDSWTIIPVPAGIINVNNSLASNGANTGGFSDSGSVLLDNGQVLIEPVNPGTSGDTCIYNSEANTWSTEQLFRGANEDEASWVKLPDGSILTIDSQTQNSERYIPSLNEWINDANVPVSLYDSIGGEMGPGFLLPNGKAFFIGSTPNTAIYTPSGGTSAGSWVQGPSIPGNQGAPDAPAAMMNNGKILCCLSPTPFGTNVFTKPTSFYEYDYTVGSVGAFTQVSAPGGGTTLNQATFVSRMLDLPDGTVLYSSGSSNLFVYVPDNSPIAAGKPTVTAYTFNPGGTVHITGTQLNGISQGAAYGDDVQQDSNYPLIRFTDGAGNIYYGTSYDWSTTGVQTGVQQVTTESTLPGVVFNGPSSFTLQVVANGNASVGYGFVGPVWVDFNYTGATVNGTFSFPYKTLAQGISAVTTSAEIFIKPGTSHETMTISKPVTIVSVGGDAIIGQ